MSCLRVLLLTLALLTGGATLAQEALAQESRGWIGTSLQDVSKAEADKLGWDGPRGAKLGSVAAGSPADKAGLKAGDIVVAIERTIIDTSSELDAAIAARRPGEEVRLQVLSGGRERRVALTVATQPRTQTADKAQLPILMLDTGGHMAVIKGLAFTPDGRQLVSAGDDKVIRVWDLQKGKTVRTIRGQAGPGHEGKVFGLALSPDGRWLAAGGWMAQGAYGSLGAPSSAVADIRLYDFAGGRLVALLKGHTDVVHSLTFSPDGKLLISGGSVSDPVAIVWNVERRAIALRLTGHKAEIYGVGFMPDGARAVTGSYDSTVKLWSLADGSEISTLTGHKERINSLTVSPFDGTIASGGWDGEIRLWDGSGRSRVLANQGGPVGAMRFSNDGKWLLTTCAYTGCSFTQSVWEVATGNRRLTYTRHDNIVRPAALSPDGRLIATGGGNQRQIDVWDFGSGATNKVLAGTGVQVLAAGFSTDSRWITWDSETKASPPAQGSGRLRWVLRLPEGGQALGQPGRVGKDSPSSFVFSKVTLGAYALSHRRGGRYGYDAILDVKKDGQTLVSIERDSTNGYQHRGYTFTPDGQTIVSGGGNGYLTAYDLNGRNIGEFVGHEGDVFDVTASPDGRLLITGSHDQTIRLWNLKTRELLVTLFHGRDGEWVMWTPQGYYTASPGADSIIGWQINKGSENAADYVGAEQLRQHLNRPDIVERAIILASAEQAVREAPGTSFKLADLLARPVPRFRIVSPASGSNERAGRTSVRIAIEATPDPVRLIRIQVNGRQVGEETPGIGSGGFGSGERALYVPLARGRNEIRVALTNAIGEKAETLVVSHDGEGDLDQRGSLHILAIGVNDYKGLPKACGKHGDASCDLSFPRNDATRFADAIERRLGPAHAQVIKRVLVNGGAAKDAPTAANITDAVEVLRHARETDTVVLFIAGHGSNEGPDYRFLPTNVEWVGGMLRGSTVVPWQVLQGAVEAAKGRRMLFVDTCHSGGAYNQRLGNSAYHANIVAYTAARFDQEAIEDTKLGHGLFTYAVVEGLEGRGDVGARRQLSTKDLAEYIRARVGALAKAANGEQEPQYFKGRDAEDFVLARW